MPIKIDPRSAADEDGIFAAPIEAMQKDAGCFSEFYIGHNRGHLGYTAAWYDALDTDEEIHKYKVEVLT